MLNDKNNAAQSTVTITEETVTKRFANVVVNGESKGKREINGTPTLLGFAQGLAQEFGIRSFTVVLGEGQTERPIKSEAEASAPVLPDTTIQVNAKDTRGRGPQPVDDESQEGSDGLIFHLGELLVLDAGFATRHRSTTHAAKVPAAALSPEKAAEQVTEVADKVLEGTDTDAQGMDELQKLADAGNPIAKQGVEMMEETGHRTTAEIKAGAEALPHATEHVPGGADSGSGRAIIGEAEEGTDPEIRISDNGVAAVDTDTDDPCDDLTDDGLASEEEEEEVIEEILAEVESGQETEANGNVSDSDPA